MFFFNIFLKLKIFKLFTKGLLSLAVKVSVENKPCLTVLTGTIQVR